jgi:hypothetical protein
MEDLPFWENPKLLESGDKYNALKMQGYMRHRRC